MSDTTNVWLLSDTHGTHKELVIPTGVDTVICTGDATSYRNAVFNYKEAVDFFEWYSELPIARKIYIAGNHDTAIANHYLTPNEFPYVEFIKNEVFYVNGHKAYGSPYTPAFGHRWVYNLRPGTEEAHWNMIPDDTDLLFTHGPPYGVLDKTSNEAVGCKALRDRIVDLYNLRLHVFGHIHPELNHPNAGVMIDFKTTYINASVVDLAYEKVNNGIIIEI